MSWPMRLSQFRRMCRRVHVQGDPNLTPVLISRTFSEGFRGQSALQRTQVTFGKRGQTKAADRVSFPPSVPRQSARLRTSSRANL